MLALPDSVTHLAVSFADALLVELDTFMPLKSIAVLEEPDVIERRNVRERAAKFPSVAGVYEAPIQAADQMTKLISEIQKPHNLKAVLPGTEYGVVAAASLAAAWKMAGIGVPAAKLFRDKAHLRHALQDSSVAQPSWALLHSAQDLESHLKEYPGQWVVKRTGRQGSLGIIFVSSPGDARRVWSELQDLPERAFSDNASHDSVLIEQRLFGRQVSVEMLIDGGSPVIQNVTSTDVFEGNHPVERTYIVPADIDESQIESLRHSALALAKASRADTGILHSEWMLTDRGPQLIECAARLPGDGLTALLKSAYGFSWIRAWVRLLERAGVAPLPLEPLQKSGARFFFFGEGRVATVTGTEAVRQMNGIDEVHLTVQAGSACVPLRENEGRHGHVVGHAINGDLLEELLNGAEGELRVTFEP